MLETGEDLVSAEMGLVPRPGRALGMVVVGPAPFKPSHTPGNWGHFSHL